MPWIDVRLCYDGCYFGSESDAAVESALQASSRADGRMALSMEGERKVFVAQEREGKKLARRVVFSV